VESLPWPIIGVDESGKGDFFGPLVIAGVLLDQNHLETMTDLGVRDSKTISDGKIIKMAGAIKTKCVHDLVVINPEKYNQLYQRIRNLNKLLGWGHARVIENILTQQSAPAAISDKFGAERFINDSLQKEGRKIELIQKVRGEAHPAVAAASILARAEFLRRMEMLSNRFGADFPRGASAKVDEAGRSLVRKKGVEFLTKVAKLHFKNYKKITA
jgi:ribonuclease HIII